MGSLSSDSESRVCAWNLLELDSETQDFTGSETYAEADSLEFAYSETNPEAKTLKFDDSMTDPEEENLEYVDCKTNPEAETQEFSDIEGEMLVYGFKQEDQRPKMKKKEKKQNQVFLEGYVEAADEDDLMRTKSLTDEDLDELKGCLDLGFGFSYDDIPELCNTLPALELCYSMSQKFIDDKQRSPEFPPVNTETCSLASGPIANWRISSPGDHPEEVKVRLKYWAQAVACTVRLCS